MTTTFWPHNAVLRLSEMNRDGKGDVGGDPRSCVKSKLETNLVSRAAILLVSAEKDRGCGDEIA